MKNTNKYIGMIALFLLLIILGNIFLPENYMPTMLSILLPEDLISAFVGKILPQNSMLIVKLAMYLLILILAFWKAVRAYKHSQKYRVYALCMLIVTMMYLLGAITWAHHELTVTGAASDKISTTLYITSNVFAVLAVLALIGVLYKKWNRFRTTVDVFVMGSFVGYVAWVGIFSEIYPRLSLESMDAQGMLVISEIFIDLMLIMGIYIIHNSDRTYFKTKYGKLQFIGFFIWSSINLVKLYMEIVKSYYLPDIFELIGPVSLLLITSGIYGMEMEVNSFQKSEFQEEIDYSYSLKSIIAPISLLFMAALIFKPIFEYIVFFALLIFFRMILYKYIKVHEDNFKLSLKYKEVNEALNIKINDINNFNLNLEKNVVERTRELEMKNQELYSTANIDPLTKIPNRRNFMNKLDNMIENGGGGNHFAVLFIDLDRFKAINDWYGHDTGDAVLIDTARRIRAVIGNLDFLARLGGDEFVVILEGIRNIEDSLNRANEIVEEFRKTFVVDGKNIVSTISIGISVYPVNSRQRTELMKFADVALYRAKTQGKNRVVIYDRYMKEEENRKLEIESRLNEGFWKGELYLEYQPQIHINSEKIVGIEALVRWKNSELGEIGPKEFIGIAEENGLIFEIGEFVIKEAFKTIKYLNEKYETNVTMAVNVSPKQFNAMNIVCNISDVIKKYDIEPSWIEVEITENLSIRNEEMVLSKLEELKKIGIAVVMDDFGTGYSSFSYLKKYPIDKLKIDRAFIIGVFDNREDYKIIKSIISMCKELGVSVIAEGVEKSNQVNVLKQLECDIIQGYYYSKPVSLEDLEKKYFKLKGEEKSIYPRWDEVYDIFELT
ncbi:MAG: EAL domain-containing protein [Proteocatella sp.]